MSDALVMCDSDGTIIHWSPAAEEWFGHRSRDVMGRSVELIIPVEFRAAHRTGLARAMGGGERHLEGAATHLPLLYADGRVVCHPARFNHIDSAEGRLVAAVAVLGPVAPDQAPWSPVTPGE